MQPFPTLQTARLLLDQPKATDIPNLVLHAGNAKIANQTLNIPHPYREEDGLAWIRHLEQEFAEAVQVSFAIRQLGDEGLLGAVGLKITPNHFRAELGYWLAEPYWGKGLVSEAVAAMLHYGFHNLGLHKIIATHLPENPASGRVMQKNGMKQEGILKDHVCKNGQFHTLIQYRITRDEYLAAQC